MLQLPHYYQKVPNELVDEAPVLVEGEEADVHYYNPCISNYGWIGNHIIVDPNGDEWASMDARITITSDSDEICALQKEAMMDSHKMKSFNVVKSQSE